MNYIQFSLIIADEMLHSSLKVAAQNISDLKK